MNIKIKGIEISVIKEDISDLNAEAIVNAANNRLSMGGGVAAAIKKRGGRAIEDEAMKKGPIDVGSALITSAGLLPAKYVIHAATMGMDFKTNEDYIRQATRSALLCAQDNKIKSIAFCALGCGTGRFSYHASSKIMAQEVFRYMREVANPSLEKIIFTLYSDDALNVFKKNVIDYLKHLTTKVSQGPFLTVDCIIAYSGGIVMIERSNPPLGWALPGGFIDYGESVEDAVAREMKEETSLDLDELKQFHVYSKPGRDPRFHTVTIVFTAKGKGTLAADSDAKAAKVFRFDDLPQKIAFDHRSILNDYRRSISK